MSATGTTHGGTPYRNPSTFHDQRIIVVGSVNSAVQIATELAKVSNVTLAVRTPVKFVPQMKFGRDVHFWLKVTGIDTFPFPLFGRVVPTPSSVIDSAGYAKLLASGEPDQKPVFTSVFGNGVIWKDGGKERVDTILFATGYQPNLSFLKGLNALDEIGAPVQK